MRLCKLRGISLSLGAATALIPLWVSTANAQARFGLEDNTDRLGGDYASSFVDDAAACRDQCSLNARCVAFTFQKPTASGQPGRCWLKATAPAPRNDSCCVSGARDAVVDLAVITANMKGTSDLPQGGGPGAIGWSERFERLAFQISLSGRPPDLISLTELDGWTWCFPNWRVGDYDTLGVLIAELLRRTYVTYRIAYLVGRSGSYGGIDSSRCHYFTGDAVLYNPARIVNTTPQDVMGRPTLAHDDAFYGVQLRRSLPICNPGSQGINVASLIDGSNQTDKCGRATPSGPAWVLVAHGQWPQGNFDAVVGSLGRFAFKHDQRTSFDVFTFHPPPGAENQLLRSMADFVEGLSQPMYRTHASLIPTLVLGDHNGLARTAWLQSVPEVFSPPGDVMAVRYGSPVGAVAARVTPVLQRTTVLPLGASGGSNSPAGGHFSDHIALRVDFTDPTAPIIVAPRPPSGGAPSDLTPKDRVCWVRPWLPQCVNR